MKRRGDCPGWAHGIVLPSANRRNATEHPDLAGCGPRQRTARTCAVRRVFAIPHFRRRPRYVITGRFAVRRPYWTPRHPRTAQGWDLGAALISSAWPRFPDADDVARGVADGGDPEIALGVGLGHDFGAALGCGAERVVEAGDVDVGHYPGLARGGQVGAPVPDDMAGAVAEARRIRAAGAQPPAKHRPVELGRLGGISCWDAQVGNAAWAGDRVFDPDSGGSGLLCHRRVPPSF